MKNRKIWLCVAIVGILAAAAVMFYLDSHRYFHYFEWSKSLLILWALCSFISFLYSKDIDRMLRGVVFKWRGGIAAFSSLFAFSLLLLFYTAIDSHHQWMSSLVAGISLLLTVGGLVFAIYSIKGYVDRLASIQDVVDRLADSLELHSSQDRTPHKFILFLCEYPAIGALSYLRGIKDADVNSFDSLRPFYNHKLISRYDSFDNAGWRVSLVCPKGCVDGLDKVTQVTDESLRSDKPYGLMNSIILDYGKDLRFSEIERKGAIELNKGLIERYFKILKQSKRFAWHWPQGLTRASKYQAILIGTCDPDGKTATAQEAFVFFALDSDAPITMPAEVKAEVAKNEAKHPSQEDIPILGWFLADRKSINSLMDEAMRVAGVQTPWELLIDADNLH